MHVIRTVALASLFVMLLLNGCIAFPVPLAEHYTNYPPGGLERPWETIKIGQTSREDVLVRFCEPYQRWHADRVLVYRWRTSHMGIVYIVTDMNSSAFTSGFDLTKDHFLLIEFDRQGKVSRFEVKHDGLPAFLLKNSWPSADVVQREQTSATVPRPCEPPLGTPL